MEPHSWSKGSFSIELGMLHSDRPITRHWLAATLPNNEEARLSLFRHIETLYNTENIHEALVLPCPRRIPGPPRAKTS